MEFTNRIFLRGIVGTVSTMQAQDIKVTRLSIVTNYAYKDRSGGAIVDMVWHNVIAYGELPDGIVKGSTVEVTGRLRFVHYTNMEGQDIRTPEVIASKGGVKLIAAPGQAGFRLEDETSKEVEAPTVIYTLVRTHIYRESATVDGANSYTSRSFSSLGRDTADTIRKVIKEDMYSEDSYASREEFESKFLFNLDNLWQLECDANSINHEGRILFEDRNDEDDLIQYVLHASILDGAKGNRKEPGKAKKL